MRHPGPVALSDGERALIAALEDGIAPESRPFARPAARLGIGEAALLKGIATLLERRVLTRFGPFIDAAAMGGAFCLCAMAVPQKRFEEVAATVNAHDEVAHNYARTDRLNMWFVLATETPQEIDTVADAIEAETGLKVLRFPKEEEYFVGFRATDGAAPIARKAAAQPLSPHDRTLLAAIQAGLPLEPAPFRAVADRLGWRESDVLARTRALLERGTIRRIAAAPNHYALGMTANGMTVWDVDDDAISKLGPRIGALPFVTHCYRRPRALPDWPYTLFAMIHGTNRAEVEAKRAQIAALLGDAAWSSDILYSTRILKKTGLRLRQREERDVPSHPDDAPARGPDARAPATGHGEAGPDLERHPAL